MAMKEYNETCPCKHCDHIRYQKYLEELEAAGGTWYWKDTGATRINRFLWWTWKVKEQTRIGIPIEAYRHYIISRWVKV
jgi:hypothetical protein